MLCALCPFVAYEMHRYLKPRTTHVCNILQKSSIYQVLVCKIRQYMYNLNDKSTSDNMYTYNSQLYIVINISTYVCF